MRSSRVFNFRSSACEAELCRCYLAAIFAGQPGVSPVEGAHELWLFRRPQLVLPDHVFDCLGLFPACGERYTTGRGGERKGMNGSLHSEILRSRSMTYTTASQQRTGETKNQSGFDGVLSKGCVA